MAQQNLIDSNGQFYGSFYDDEPEAKRFVDYHMKQGRGDFKLHSSDGKTTTLSKFSKSMGKKLANRGK